MKLTNAFVLAFATLAAAQLDTNSGNNAVPAPTNTEITNVNSTSSIQNAASSRISSLSSSLSSQLSSITSAYSGSEASSRVASATSNAGSKSSSISSSASSHIANPTTPNLAAQMTQGLLVAAGGVIGLAALL